MLGDEDELASYWLRMLYKVSQEVFLEAGAGVQTTCLTMNASQPHASP